MRRPLIVVIVLSATFVLAQSGDQKTAAEKCLVDLPQWQTYASTVKLSRDGAEQELSSWKVRAETLRLEVEKLTKRVAELEKK
jgi:hypothetical protein